MWSIIKKAVNSDLSTPLNIPINAIKAKTDLITQIKSKTDLIMGKCQLFLANGTFVVPTGVYAVYLTGCAAGNNGTAGTAGAGGAGGAGGEMIFDFLIPNITPGQSITVTVGTGNTSFGTHLTLVKGGGAAGGAGGSIDTAGAAGGAGGGSLIKEGVPYYGGAGGARGTGNGSGGGGGGAYGAGGAGGAFEAGGAGGAGYGSGGGGGGGGAYGAGGAGGAGRPGFLLVRWL